jgi:hypothetical protein
MAMRLDIFQGGKEDEKKGEKGEARRKNDEKEHMSSHVR